MNKTKFLSTFNRFYTKLLTICVSRKVIQTSNIFFKNCKFIGFVKPCAVHDIININIIALTKATFNQFNLFLASKNLLNIIFK